MDFATIAAAQNQDVDLVQQAQVRPNRFERRLLATDADVLHYRTTPDGPWKIYLPTALLLKVVRWYHLALGHCGISRLVDTLRIHFHHPNL